MFHHTKNKGDVGVLKAMADLACRGYLVLTPHTEHAPFDVVAYKANKFFRVQVKYVSRKFDKINIGTRSSWSDKHGRHTRFLDASAADVVCAYCPETDKCYYVPTRDFPSAGGLSLRFTVAKNNQRCGVRMAADYMLF